MADLKTTIQAMTADGAFRKLLVNPLSQFGRTGRMYLGATILPERLVPNNKYTETMIKYRTVLANDATRYSPAQKKGNDIVGSMDVSLQEQDIAAEYTSEDYDAALAVANVNSMTGNVGNPDMGGVVAITNWFNTRVNLALIEKIEKMRFEALVSASIALSGDNGYTDTVTYPNPTGQRVAAAGSWIDNNYDPLQDLFERMTFAASKGYTIGRIIAGNPVIFALLNNTKVKAAVGGYVSVNSGGALTASQARVSLQALNTYLNENSLPTIEPYNLQYRTQTGSGFFMPRNAMLLLATTERDVEIDLGDLEQLPIRSVAGYVGVGRAAGQPNSGRAVDMQVFTKKPPRVEAEGWQTSLPVITDPESVFVLSGITTP